MKRLGFGFAIAVAVVAAPGTEIAAQSVALETENLANLIRIAAKDARFPGRVVAANQTDVSSTLDSVITQIHFLPEQFVEAGDALFTLDATEFELAVRVAEANAIDVRANYSQVNQEFLRTKELFDRGNVSIAQMQRLQAQHDVSRARVALAEASLDAARIDLERTVIRAPISGRVGRPTVSVGSYVEAEAGAPMARIVQLDPVLVAYEEPYAEQVKLFASAGMDTPEDFLEMLTVRLEIAENLIYSGVSKPSRASSSVDPETGSVTVWAEFENPNSVLRPGMRVTVLVELDETNLP